MNWLVEGLKEFFPDAHIHLTDHTVGITIIDSGIPQWYGLLFNMPTRGTRQSFIDDTVKWFQERFNLK